jgi:Spy/CpxP family protein refolding chaperone
MMKQLAALIAVLPIAAFAQGAGPASRGGPGQGPGPGTDERIEKMEKRARLARNLGLAEALDLDTAQSNKLADALAKADDKRVAIHRQTRDARQLLRRAADGEKVTAAEVDAALAKLLDLRAQSVALDRETLTIVTRDLSPEKKARAALFLGRFQQRMGGGMGQPGMGPGMGGGMGGGRGKGMGPGHGPGMMGPGGMGPGGMGAGHEGCPNCPWDDDHD